MARDQEQPVTAGEARVGTVGGIKSHNLSHRSTPIPSLSLPGGEAAANRERSGPQPLVFPLQCEMLLRWAPSLQ
ncbi:Protocadherin Fat 4, partial [Dissostichus eleginoides]